MGHIFRLSVPLLYRILSYKNFILSIKMILSLALHAEKSIKAHLTPVCLDLCIHQQ